MTIFEIIKRRIRRASRPLNQWIGYVNDSDGPALRFVVGQGYEVDVTFTDLAHLVRAADRFAANVENDVFNLTNWRDLE